MSVRALTLCIALAAGLADAQEPARKLPEIVVQTYESRTSWPLFACCDKDSDDRLDLFEADEGIVGLPAREQPTTFRMLDLDSDGFLQWLEFDAYVRETLANAGTVTIQPSRPFRIPFDPTEADRPGSREAALMRLVDLNDDQQLSPREFRDFIVDAGLGSVAPGFAEIDTDGSGFLTIAEFAVVVTLLPDSGQRMLARAEQDPETVPFAYRSADRNRDGLLDRDELQVTLVAIDPSLRRWTDRILEDADRSGNGKLDRTEIQRAK